MLKCLLALAFRLGIDQIGNGFGLKKIQPTFLHRTFGELSWFSRSRAQISQSIRNAGNNGWSGVKVEFKPVFPSVRFWTWEPENYGMIQNFALMTKAAKAGASRFREGAAEVLEQFRTSWSASAHDGNGRTARTCC